MQYLDYLASEYPQLVKVQSIGKSYEDRALKIVKISSGPGKSGEPKPAIWIDAGESYLTKKSYIIFEDFNGDDDDELCRYARPGVDKHRGGDLHHKSAGGEKRELHQASGLDRLDHHAHGQSRWLRIHPHGRSALEEDSQRARF